MDVCLVIGMTKGKKIKELIYSISKKKPEREDIKKFSSFFIELMAKSGIPPSVRKELFLQSQKSIPNIDKIIAIARDNMCIILEKI